MECVIWSFWVMYLLYWCRNCSDSVMWVVLSVVRGKSGMHTCRDLNTCIHVGFCRQLPNCNYLDANCLVCLVEDNYCLKCVVGYTLDKNVCVPKIPGCIVYSFDEQSCALCDSPYVLTRNPGGSTCVIPGETVEGCESTSPDKHGCFTCLLTSTSSPVQTTYCVSNRRVSPALRESMLEHMALSERLAARAIRSRFSRVRCVCHAMRTALTVD